MLLAWDRERTHLGDWFLTAAFFVVAAVVFSVAADVSLEVVSEVLSLSSDSVVVSAALSDSVPEMLSDPDVVAVVILMDSELSDVSLNEVVNVTSGVLLHEVSTNRRPISTDAAISLIIVLFMLTPLPADLLQGQTT